MATKPKDIQFTFTDEHGKHVQTDLTKWMRQMYDWGIRVRHDIVELEKKCGITKKGDPGDPPPPPDSGQ